MDERYSAKLLTPKSRLLEADPDLERAPLLESQQLRTIKADYQQSPQTFDDKIEAAKGVGLLVRQTLDFSTTSDFTPVFNVETLAGREMANCFVLWLYDYGVRVLGRGWHRTSYNLR